MGNHDLRVPPVGSTTDRGEEISPGTNNVPGTIPLPPQPADANPQLHHALEALTAGRGQQGTPISPVPIDFSAPPNRPSLKKVLVFASGGNAPGQNALLKSLAIYLLQEEVEVLIVDGGVAELSREDPHIRDLSLEEARTIDERAGSVVIGTTRSKEEAVPTIVRNVQQTGADRVVVIGGDGSLTLAQKLEASGIPTVGIPKSMDGNLGINTDGGPQRLMSIGFISTIQRAIGYLEDLGRRAREEKKIILLEVNGRDTGWIALTAALIAKVPCFIDEEKPALQELEEIAGKLKGLGGVLIVAESTRFWRGDTEVTMDSLRETDDEWDTEKLLECNLKHAGFQVRSVDLSPLLAARGSGNVDLWIRNLKESALQQRRINIVKIPQVVFEKMNKSDPTVLFLDGAHSTGEVVSQITERSRNHPLALIVISERHELTGGVRPAQLAERDPRGRLQYSSRQVGRTLAVYLRRTLGVRTDYFNSTHFLMAESPTEDEIALAQQVGAETAKLILTEQIHGSLVAARVADREIVTAPLDNIVNMRVPTTAEKGDRKAAPEVAQSMGVWFRSKEMEGRIVSLPEREGQPAFELTVTMSREMHVAPSANVFNMARAHPGVKLWVKPEGENEFYEINSPMILISMGVDLGDEVKWMASGPGAREVLGQIWLWNEQKWPNVVPESGNAVPTVTFSRLSAKAVTPEVISFSSRWLIEMVSGVYDLDSGKMALGDSKYGHEAIAMAAGMEEAWNAGRITRIVFVRPFKSPDTLRAYFPHLRIQDSDVGKVSLLTRLESLFRGVQFSTRNGEVIIDSVTPTKPLHPSISIPAVVAPAYPLYDRTDFRTNRGDLVYDVISELTKNHEEGMNRLKDLTRNERIELYLRLGQALRFDTHINSASAVRILEAIASDLPFRERFDLLRHLDFLFRHAEFDPKWTALGLIMAFQRDFFQARLDYSLYEMGEQIRGKTIVVNAATLFYGNNRGHDSTKLILRAGYEAFLEGLSQNNKLILYSPYPNKDIRRLFAKYPTLRRAFTGSPAASPLTLSAANGVITLKDHVRALRSFLNWLEQNSSGLTPDERDYWSSLQSSPGRALAGPHPILFREMGLCPDYYIDDGSAPDEAPFMTGNHIIKIGSETKPSGVIWDLATVIKKGEVRNPSCIISRTRLPIGYPKEKRVLVHFGLVHKVRKKVIEELEKRIGGLGRERPVRRDAAVGGMGGEILQISTGLGGKGRDGEPRVVLGNLALMHSESVSGEAALSIVRDNPTPPSFQPDRIIDALFDRVISLAHERGFTKAGSLLARLKDHVREHPGDLRPLLSRDKLIGFLKKRGYEKEADLLRQKGTDLGGLERLVLYAAVVTGQQPERAFEGSGLSKNRPSGTMMTVRGINALPSSFQNGSTVFNLVR